ncbi:MAG: M13 family metallopeptidase [Steroidobacteraceae bacterium]
MTRPIRLFTAAIACAGAACSRSPGPASAPRAPSATSRAASGAARAAKRPDIGIDLAYIDHSMKPGDDFFLYANGAWLATAKIPADLAHVGAFHDMFQVTEQRVADLIRNAGEGHPAAGSNARKIADYYAAYMNTRAIEAAGLAPLQPQLDAIDAVRTRKDLARVLGSRLRADVDPINDTHFHTQHLFGLFVTKGLTEESLQIPYLLQGGLGMPSREYYLSNDPHMAKARSEYQTYIAALLKRAGVAGAGKQARIIFGLETKIARAQASLIDSEDIRKAGTIWSVAQFPAKAPGLYWSAYFDAAGLGGVKRIDVWQASAIRGLSRLVSTQPLGAWKALLVFHTLNAAAPLLPKAFADLYFGFYGTDLQGIPQQRARWKRAVEATSTDLGDAVGELYVRKYFPPSSKAAVQAVVANLLTAFRQGIENLTWMTPATKRKAEAKLTTLDVGIGYPDHWRNDSGLEIKRDDALGNHLRAVRFHYEWTRAKIGKPIDRGEWWMSPQTVNALNLPIQNALNFPAAILQPPFFDPHADPAANYGAIGAIIGHEVSHSFDNTGSEFDAQGRLENWWTPADLEHFEAATAALAKQYSAYEALPGLHVNGKQTLGEDIADVSGLTAAYRAYHLSLGGQPAPVIDGRTGDQRFFLAYAQAWRAKIRPAALRQRLATDVHAPAHFRAQTVRNLDPWYRAFDVQPGQTLYLAPDRRVRIW